MRQLSGFQRLNSYMSRARPGVIERAHEQTAMPTPKGAIAVTPHSRGIGLYWAVFCRKIIQAPAAAWHRGSTQVLCPSPPVPAKIVLSTGLDRYRKFPPDASFWSSRLAEPF
ncbi:hypothetical protein V2G26_011713 [Clonostachys chloroleuca]